MIRAILFDAGNTLIRMDYAAIAAELRRHGITLTPDDLQRGDWTARVRLDTDLFTPGTTFSTESRDTTARYTQYLLEGAGVHGAALHAKLMDWRRAYNPPVGLWTVAEPEAAAALALARDAGRVTGVVSNSNGTIRQILESLGLARHLDFVLDSHEEGVEKPDPRFFEIALTRSGGRAGTTMHVGDLYHVDVVGARRAGLQAILLDAAGLYEGYDCERVSTLDALVDSVARAQQA
jgi:HAD superfamily hydrolase (TIGR01549 family)